MSGSDSQANADTNVDTPQQQSGIVSGPGNQGTASTVIMNGHAGTPASQLGIPRQQGFGNPGAKP